MSVLGGPPLVGEGRRASAAVPAILAIGASTGGPQALVALLAGLAPRLRTDVPLPVCVTLHMPRDLMPVIAAHVARRCGIATTIVDQPCRLRGGCVFFAPGDRHLGCAREGGDVTLVPVISPSSAPPALPLRRKSAVDAMFLAVAGVFGARGLGIVLSGMGDDGLAGSRAIVEQGGDVLVQDRASSAVWGMPGAVVQAGLATRVLPPSALAVEVIARAAGGWFRPAPHRPPFDSAPERQAPEVRR